MTASQDSTQETASIPPSTRLRRLLNDSNRLIVCPGVYDGFSARIAMDVGFDALYMVSNSHLRYCPSLLLYVL